MSLLQEKIEVMKVYRKNKKEVFHLLITPDIIFICIDKNKTTIIEYNRRPVDDIINED